MIFLLVYDLEQHFLFNILISIKTQTRKTEKKMMIYQVLKMIVNHSSSTPNLKKNLDNILKIWDLLQAREATA